jgi:dTMP kinase
MKSNLFIVFEGIDGSGKSTQVKLLSDKLKKEGQKVYTTFEPTDSPIGSLIRNIFSKRIVADDKTIAGLFIADRLDHLLNETNGILKKLNEGYTVISDRYYFSSYAYHSVHVPMKWVIESNSLSSEILKPDLNIYIDISPELSMARLLNGRNSIDLYETVENLRIVRKNYFEAFKLHENKEKIFFTDGNRSTEIIASEIWDEITRISYEKTI